MDDADKFFQLMTAINGFANTRIIFPVHPRTKKNLDRIGNIKNIVTTDSLSYLEFIYLMKESKGVITDSGGVQAETTVLGIPCVTLRNNTERPETVYIGGK